MWARIANFLLKAHASGLGHDVIIEILIALLGLMIAVLTLIAGLVSVIVAIIGVFGFQTIRDEAKKKASEIATNIATITANRIAQEIADENSTYMRDRGQASGLSESEAEEMVEKSSVTLKRRSGRIKATTDKSLQKNEDGL